MATDVQTQTGQAQADGCPQVSASPGMRQEPQTLIQESIKYRRRAQEAERHAETLEAELDALRRTDQGRTASLESELDQARAEADTLRARFETVERDRRLERELLRAGCADSETALALARERLAGGDPPEDLAAFAKRLIEEKPLLKSHAPAAGTRDTGGMPLPTACAKPTDGGSVRRVAQRLADRARETGSASDVMAYMRARRGHSA